MMSSVMAGVLAFAMCMPPATTPLVDGQRPLRTCKAEAGEIGRAPGPLALAASKAGVPFKATTAVARPQSTQQRKSNAVAWGAGIGAAAGVTGGFLQPTHGNGEYVLGDSRTTSALALGAIGAGIGALIGWTIDKAR